MIQYIDIHSHILPGIDDGAKDFSTSMKMLRTAFKDGAEQIIATPHNKPGRHNAGAERMASLIAELEKQLKDEGIPLKLYPGNEFYYRAGLTEEIMEGKGLTMAGTSFVLTEFSPMDDYDYIRNGIYSLVAFGYRPILAHVERYSKINGRTDRVEDLTEMGCYIQVNAGSVMGDLGFGTKLFTRKLLREGLLHFIASDAHDTGNRPPKLSACASYVEKKYGKAYALELFYENPMHVIRNESI
jgi:protein-tyrosine phosphatase